MIDTSNMNTLSLFTHLRKIKEPNIMQIWEEVVKEYLTAILMNTGISTTTSSHDSSSKMILIEQDNEDNEDISDNYCIVMTIL